MPYNDIDRAQHCLTTPSHYLEQCWFIIVGVDGVHGMCSWTEFKYRFPLRVNTSSFSYARYLKSNDAVQHMIFLAKYNTQLYIRKNWFQHQNDNNKVMLIMIDVVDDDDDDYHYHNDDMSSGNSTPDQIPIVFYLK